MLLPDGHEDNSSLSNPLHRGRIPLNIEVEILLFSPPLPFSKIKLLQRCPQAAPQENQVLLRQINHNSVRGFNIVLHAQPS